jgi:hypothetical protein
MGKKDMGGHLKPIPSEYLRVEVKKPLADAARGFLITWFSRWIVGLTAGGTC